MVIAAVIAAVLVFSGWALREVPVIHRPPAVGAFEFVVLATLRAAQLMRGCRPRVDGVHKATVTAQFEVAEGKVLRLFEAPAIAGEPDGIDDAPAEIEPLLVQRT
jgi:hypothetical protein